MRAVDGFSFIQHGRTMGLETSFDVIDNDSIEDARIVVIANEPISVDSIDARCDVFAPASFGMYFQRPSSTGDTWRYSRAAPTMPQHGVS